MLLNALIPIGVVQEEELEGFDSDEFLDGELFAAELVEDPALFENNGLLNRLRFNAFADLTLGFESGGPADSDEAALFEAFGTDEFPLNTFGDGFNIVGSDFVVTMDLTPNLVFQSEINFQVSRGSSSEFEIDPERFFLDYRHSDTFNIQAGLFFTPIGYHNRFLYSRAWLMHSVQVPDLFEEELNLVPTHSVGVNAHGRIDLFGQEFNYVLGVGNGRGITPVENQYARDVEAKEISVLLEWIVPNYEDFLIGVSGWTDEINTFAVGAIGNSVDINTATPLSEREYGTDVYVTYYGEKFNLLAEGVYSTIGDDDLTGATAELSLNLMDNRVHPYVRYDFTNLPGGDQGDYYGLRLEGDTLTKHYIPEFDAGMIGVNYDWNTNTRLKAEVIRHFSGVREELAIVFQVAWGF